MSGGLSRHLTVWPCAFIITANMIGTGIFTTTGFLAADLGSPWLILLIWLVGGLISLTGALTYAELGINFPKSGGEYLYLREAYGGAIAFVAGWLTFFAGFAAPIAAAAMALSEYLSAVYKGLPPTTVAAIVIGFLTIVNFFKIYWVGFFQSLLTLIKIMSIFGFLIFGLLSSHGDLNHFFINATRESAIPIYQQFPVSLVFVLFAYSGWNAANYVVEEIKDPQKTLPKAIFLGLGLVTLIYLLLNFLFIYALPAGQLAKVIKIGAVTAEALGGPKAALLFSILFAISLFSTVNAMTLIGPRVYYAMAKDHLFLPWAAKIHPRWQTPWISVLLQGLCSLILLLTQSFESLIVYVGSAISLFSVLTGGTIFLFRQRPHWKPFGANNFFYPLIPGLFVLSTLWVFIYTCYWRPKPMIVTSLTLVVGFMVFVVLKKLARLGDHP